MYKYEKNEESGPSKNKKKQKTKQQYVTTCNCQFIVMNFEL